MADRETSSLFLEVDAPTEAMRQQLAIGEGALVAFDRKAAKIAESVGRQIAKMGDQSFGPFQSSAAAAAQKVENEFASSFSRIQALASKSTANAGTGLTVGAAEARAAADAAQQRVAALRAIEDAVNRAATAQGRLTSAYGIDLQAARTATIAAEERARALALEAGQLEALELEMRRAGGATTSLGSQQRVVTAQSGAMRAGMQNLSYQISDMSVQLGAAAGSANGAKLAFMAFTQQFPQAIQAVAMMRQETSGFISFMAGPWGAAITGAITLLGSLALAYYGAADGADAATNALDRLIKKRREELAEKTQSTDAEKELNKLIERRAQLMDYIAKNGVKNSNGFVQFVYRQQAELADVNKQIYEARNAIDAERGRALGTPSAIAEQIERGKIRDQAKADRNAASAAKRAEAKQAAAERKAEAERKQALAEDSAFAQAERQAKHRLLDAMGKTATSEQQRDQLLRDDIDAEARANKRKIANDLAAGKISAAEAENLTTLEERVRQQRLGNVMINRLSEIIRTRAELEEQALDDQIALAQIDGEMALTTAERRDVAQRLLALEKKREQIAIDAVLSDPKRTEAERAQAQAAQANLESRYAARSALADRQNASPLEEYRTRLIAATKDIDAAFESVEANGLQSLEDGLVGVVSGTESLGSAFKKMANQIIADLIRIGVQKAILGSITGGGVFSFLGFSGGGKVQGHATGGYISGPGTATSDDIPAWLSDGEYVLRAAAVRRVGVRALDALNSGQTPRFAAGGLVSPRLPVVRTGSSAGGGDGAGGVTIQINAPGATAETVAMIRRELANALPVIVQTATANTTRQLNRRSL